MFDLTVYDTWTKDGRTLPSGRPHWMGTLDLDQLTRRMVKFTELANKGASWSWSPVRLLPMDDGTYRRRNSLVEFLSCLVVDLDHGGIDRATLREAFGPVHAIYHSSHSSTPDAPKGRAVLPLASPCPALLWGRMWSWVESRLGSLVDRQCKDPARLFYLPSHPPGADPTSWVQPGDLLEVDYLALPMTEAEEQAAQVRLRRHNRPRYAGSLREIQEALKHDPAVRLKAAQALGAAMVDNRATRILCPDCGRPAVWFLLNKGTQARCNHVNSCGAAFWLDQLMENM